MPTVHKRVLGIARYLRDEVFEDNEVYSCIDGLRHISPDFPWFMLGELIQGMAQDKLYEKAGLTAWEIGRLCFRPELWEGSPKQLPLPGLASYLESIDGLGTSCPRRISESRWRSLRGRLRDEHREMESVLGIDRSARARGFAADEEFNDLLASVRLEAKALVVAREKAPQASSDTPATAPIPPIGLKEECREALRFFGKPETALSRFPTLPRQFQLICCFWRAKDELGPAKIRNSFQARFANCGYSLPDGAPGRDRVKKAIAAGSALLESI
jgi:hypothetical protein